MWFISLHTIWKFTIKYFQIDCTWDPWRTHSYLIGSPTPWWCSVYAESVLSNEWVIHIRWDAFFSVDGVGLTHHVPSLQGASLPEWRHDSLYFYSCSLWNLSCATLHTIEVTFNNILGHICHLPHSCHTRNYNLHLTACLPSILNSALCFRTPAF